MMDDLLVRPATLNDAELLYKWRNDPLTRQMSRNSDPVAWGDHCNWLARRLDRLVPGLFIGELDSVPVCTFRIDDDQISYTVAPEHRNRGIATKLLSKVRQEIGNFTAEIFPRNIASIKAASAAGLKVVLIADQ